MIIAINLDDTIMDTHNVLPGYRMGQPEPGAVMALKQLHTLGHQIFIFTARDVQNPAVKKAVGDWCDHFDIPYSGITNIKSPHFEVFLDNKAIHFDNWPQSLVALTSVNASGRFTI